MKKFLAIETSCDETACAIYCAKNGLIANQIYSQIKLHQAYGGVVPEIASRNHLAKIGFILDKTLNQANCNLKDIGIIAATIGPGLSGALLVGASFAQSLAFSQQTVFMPIHHLEGHLVVPMLEDKTLQFPFLSVLISGGHTLLIEAKKLGQYHILGQTKDDALGEAFDKVAKMMGLGYPGGAQLSQLAQKCTKSSYFFPRPMIDQDNCDFSFSGLKTHSLITYQKSNKNENDKANIAKAFEDAIIDLLISKIKKAKKNKADLPLVVSGGVSANKPLRKALIQEFGKDKVFFPALKLCTDNAAMIAYCAYLHWQNKSSILANNYQIKIFPRWQLTALNN